MIDLVAAALFETAWKGTLLVAFALVVHRVARNRIPPRWLAALLFVAVLRLLLPVAPQSSVSVFNLFRASSPATATVIVAGDSSPLRTRVAMPSPSPQAESRAPWTVFLLAVWAAGAVFCLVRTGVQSSRFRRRLCDLRPVDLGGLLEECCTALHLRRRVRVASTAAVDTPSLHGWLRPTLLLPHDFLDSFSRAQLRYVVLHELAHVRRADVLVSWMATAASALHWFNPLVRLAVSRMFEERELACDALALAALRADERPAYGGTVLAIAERSNDLVPALVGMTTNPRQLKRRILMIAAFKQSRSSILFAALVAAVVMTTFTDARAGEKRKIVRHMTLEAPSAAAQENIQRLEQNMSVDLRSASVRDVLNAIANATGVSGTIAEGALEGDPRVNVRGTNVPAHVVLFETMSALDLAVKFTDAGVEIVSAPEIAPEGMKERFVIRAPHAAEDGDKERKRVEIQVKGEDGKRTVSINGGEGTLEIEKAQ